MELERYRGQLSESCRYLAGVMPVCPKIGIIAGTGLGNLVSAAEVETEWPYGSIPNFPVSTVESHQGRLILGRVANQDVVMFQGRFHLYEGYSPWEVTFPLRVLMSCGLQTLIITNAAGGLNPEFSTGDIMVLSDHINFTGENPLAGPHDPEWGPRFPDMSAVYDERLQALAATAAADAGFSLQRGVYVGVKGPSLETPAETRLFRQIGADAIGMSTVPEAIVAVQGGLRILGLSVITNVNNPDDMAATSLADVIGVAQGAAPRLSTVIRGVVGGR